MPSPKPLPLGSTRLPCRLRTAGGCSTSEAADRLGCSTRWVRERVKRGDLADVRLDGGALAFDVEDLRAFAAERRVGGSNRLSELAVTGEPRRHVRLNQAVRVKAALCVAPSEILDPGLRDARVMHAPANGGEQWRTSGVAETPNVAQLGGSATGGD